MYIRLGKRSFLLCIVLLCGILSTGLSTAIKAQELKLYVATNGNDAWSGKTPEIKNGDGPFATLERARDEIRKIKKNEGLLKGGVIVELAQGVYALTKTFELTSEDSGTNATPIIYQAKKGAEVRLFGGKMLRNFTVVTDPKILARLDETARGNVLQTNLLKLISITEFGEPSGGFGKPSGAFVDLFFKDEPMQISRWPNDGTVKIVNVSGDNPFSIRGTKGDKTGSFIYKNKRPERWVNEKDIWLHGYWFWDWADQRQKVKLIDTEKQKILLEPPHHGYGYRKGQWYYAYNLLIELDTPGEWYLDRETSILYFWPPTPIDNNRLYLSNITTLVSMKDTSYVTFKELIFEGARKTVINIKNGKENSISNCTIRNSGSWAVKISGGEHNGVKGCNLYNLGKGGISLSGGNRKTLTPANHYASNNHIHHYARWSRMINPGVSLSGVGQHAAHNLINDAPHQAISFSGNNHLIELNEIHNVCSESNDAGAIYAGRDWTMRGTIIRYNYLHDIKGLKNKGCKGVYLDDMFSGTSIYGNIFYKVHNAVFIGGGRDNIVENNVFIDSPQAIHIDARAMGWAKHHVNATLKPRLLAMPYTEKLWLSHYPALAIILNDEPAIPKGNKIIHNVTNDNNWSDIHDTARPHTSITNNSFNVDPRYITQSDLSGFKAIPSENIGLERCEEKQKLNKCTFRELPNF